MADTTLLEMIKHCVVGPGRKAGSPMLHSDPEMEELVFARGREAGHDDIQYNNEAVDLWVSDFPSPPIGHCVPGEWVRILREHRCQPTDCTRHLNVKHVFDVR